MWEKLYDEKGNLKYEGYTKLDEENKMVLPFGIGIRYYENGVKYLEGIFADWFIEIGREYYPSGVLKFEGEYNKGQRSYYGPRYYARGNYYRENGSLWFSGIYKVNKVGSMNYPLISVPNIFYDGIEYDEQGNQIIHLPKDFNMF